MSYDFLLASWGTCGNLNPLLTAGRQLRRNGHGVRVMADAAMRDEVEAANIEFVTWCRAPIGIAADPTNISDMGDWARQSAIVHEMEAIVAARRGARTAVQKALRA